ncbi:MAG TPA: Crp/Fnr family transcriptional regulator [Beijerinckiaceae bacterium]|nr:Crp/Fnr family transcriptional regulator [Beijerinckiaceae bacterium]
MTPSTASQRQSARNNLLDALQPADRALLAPHLEKVMLSKGDVLFAPGDEVTIVHFPCNATIASLLIAMSPGDMVETASIGREGAVGGIVSQGALPAYTQAVVQIGGPTYRMALASLQEAKARSLTLRNLFARYADCLLSQVLQSVACNALHPIDQRCARWLLSMRDRIGANNLPLTQETLAQMLGIQRTYLSKVFGRFKCEGLVKTTRGRVELIDIDRLEGASCECYGQVKHHFERVLKGVYPEDDLSFSDTA